jgi:transcriptional regulator with XRE-family HTH domain
MQDTTVPNVGQIIRELRKEQGISLRTLAERCGLSINAISRIERGENSPTVQSLHRLSVALGVPITALFREDTTESVILIKKNQGRRQELDGMVMASLGGGLLQQVLQPFLITLEPGLTSGNHPVSHLGEEFVYCLEGEIEYCISDEKYTLHAGDSLIFKAVQSHSWANRTPHPARAILIFQTDQSHHIPPQHS